MIKCVLVDDEKYYLEYLQDLFSQLPEDFDFKIVKTFNSPTKAIAEIPHLDCDLLFIDYNLKSYTGIEVAKELGSELPIVFITSHTDMNQTIFNKVNNIVGVLNKPTQLKDLIQIIKDKNLNTKRTKKRPTHQKIPISLGKGNKGFIINSDEIFYIRSEKKSDIPKEQGDKKYCRFYGYNENSKEGNVITRKIITLSKLEDLLKDFDFQRISKSHIVNNSKVKEWFSSSVILEDETIIEASDTYKDSYFKGLLKKFLKK